jgi:hypothetical protein
MRWISFAGFYLNNSITCTPWLMIQYDQVIRQQQLGKKREPGCFSFDCDLYGCLNFPLFGTHVSVPMDNKTRTGKAGQTPLRYKILMVTIAIATLLAIWLVPDEKQPTPPPLPELPATQMTDADLFQPAEGDPAAIREGDRARAFITSMRNDGTEPDPDAAFVEALRLQGGGYAVDAYLLFRFAARHGHGQAALVLGNQADPAYRDTDIPDSLQDQPEQAYKWYSIAAEEGIEEAAAQLQALRKRMEQAASNGDERAQRLLLLWN